ncbi:MAG: hypothetical protein ACPGWR_01010 [Ardenticatenaceae bacterium]
MSSLAAAELRAKTYNSVDPAISIKCAECGVEFDARERVDGDNPGALAQVKYHSKGCKRRVNNRTHYARYREREIARAIKHKALRKARREAKGA